MGFEPMTFSLEG